MLISLSLLVFLWCLHIFKMKHTRHPVLMMLQRIKLFADYLRLDSYRFCHSQQVWLIIQVQKSIWNQSHPDKASTPGQSLSASLLTSMSLLGQQEFLHKGHQEHSDWNHLQPGFIQKLPIFLSAKWGFGSSVSILLSFVHLLNQFKSGYFLMFSTRFKTTTWMENTKHIAKVNIIIIPTVRVKHNL